VCGIRGLCSGAAAVRPGRVSPATLSDALLLCGLLAATDPKRYDRAALRWLQRFIDERLPPPTEVALAASALAELRHGKPAVGVAPLKSLGAYLAPHRGLAERGPDKNKNQPCDDDDADK
jgi:hypothetical protein